MRRLLVAIALACVAALVLTRAATVTETVNEPPLQLAESQCESDHSERKSDGPELDDELVQHHATDARHAAPVRVRAMVRSARIEARGPARLERPPRSRV